MGVLLRKRLHISRRRGRRSTHEVLAGATWPKPRMRSTRPPRFGTRSRLCSTKRLRQSPSARR